MNVSRADLLWQLESVQAGLASSEVMEQSDCFIFKDGYVQTYNDEVSCRCKSALQIEGAVKAEPLLNLLRKMVEDTVEIELGEDRITVHGKKKKAWVIMEDKISLPVDSVDKPKEWKPAPEDFGEAINIVQHCASNDESQFATCCIHIHPKWVEAFDNFQLSRYRIDTGIEKRTVIRRNTILSVIPIGVTKIAESESWMHFKGGNGVTISCKQYYDAVDDFPSLSKILKTEGDPMKLPKSLGAASEKAAVFLNKDKEERLIRVDLRKGKGRITAIGAVGGYEQRFPKMRYEGEEMSFLIAPELLQNIVTHHNECELSQTYLKVNGGNFIYMTRLGELED